MTSLEAMLGELCLGVLTLSLVSSRAWLSPWLPAGDPLLPVYRARDGHGPLDEFPIG
jgi:hypothetical protein